MQIIVNGLISGLSLALLAAAFSVVYVPTRVFYIALAGIYTLVPFVAWACLQNLIPVPAAVFVAVLCGTLLSIGCEMFNHGPLDTKGASSGAHMVSSLGVYILLSQCAAIFWGNETKVLRTGVDTVSTFSGIILTQSQQISVVVSVMVLTLYFVVLHGSKAGTRFRAMADNATEFVLRGHNLSVMRIASFAASGALCSVSSLLVAYDIGFDAHGGLTAVLLAIVGVIIGGRKSFNGPIIGAICLSLIRAMVIWVFSAQWAEAFTFAVLAAVLLIRPEGMLSFRMRLEAAS